MCSSDLAKVTGAATFGIDVRLPGMLFAAVRHPPTIGGSLKGFTVKGGLPKGVEKVVAIPGGIAAIGRSWWQANTFLDSGVDIAWEAGPHAKLDSATLWKQYEQSLEKGDAAVVRTLGTEGQSGQVRTIEATYKAPYLAHATMEPMNCTARVADGKVELWMPDQSPTLMRLAAAKAADVSQADVTVHTTFLGGGFGRRAEADLVREAVACALAMPGRPVQVLWSREEDIRNDPYRPMALARWRAELGQAGAQPSLVSVRKRQVAQSPAEDRKSTRLNSSHT